MLHDVLSACTAVARTVVVTDDEEAARQAADRGVGLARDPGEGQGAAVAAALAELVEPEPVVVVNADVPCAVPRDLRTLLAATPLGGIALVEAIDGTTNALSLPAPQVFAPVYGVGSAERFLEHARSLALEAVSVSVPNLRDDVDTLADLYRLQLRVGPHTQAAMMELEQEIRV
jgi:2-phospho-L-lactate guanylyltransferase